jgi:hypothetical protein
VIGEIMTDTTKSDLLGLAPYGEAIKVATEKTIDGISKFLNALCMPACEEFGLYLKDNVSSWRRKNAIKMLGCAEEITKTINIQGTVHPKTLHHIIEAASWEDNTEVNKLWSGLLASAIGTGQDGGDQLYIETLKSISPSQCKLIIYGVNSCTVRDNEKGLLLSDPLTITIDEALSIVGYSDIQRLDREIDDLHRKDLICNGIDVEDLVVDIAPRPLAMHLISRCQNGQTDICTYFSSKGQLKSRISNDEIILIKYMQLAKLLPDKYEKKVEEQQRYIKMKNK